MTLASPLGDLTVAASCRGVVRVALPTTSFLDLVAHCLRRYDDMELARMPAPSSWLEPAARAIEATLGGTEPTLPAMDLDATEFEQSVLDEICAIPRGETRSYGEIAEAIGRPDASRAVGQACGANPVPILIPCHRVLGQRGGLVGFGGGMELKVRLLALEGVLLT